MEFTSFSGLSPHSLDTCLGAAILGLFGFVILLISFWCIKDEDWFC